MMFHMVGEKQIKNWDFFFFFFFKTACVCVCVLRQDDIPLTEQCTAPSERTTTSEVDQDDRVMLPLDPARVAVV